MFQEAKQIIHTHREFMMGKELKFDRWGYEVNTSSDACLSAINSYYLEVYFWIHAYFFLVKQNDFSYCVMLEMNEFMNFWFLGSQLWKKEVSNIGSSDKWSKMRSGEHFSCSFSLLLRPFSCSTTNRCCQVRSCMIFLVFYKKFFVGFVFGSHFFVNFFVWSYFSFLIW